MITRCSHTATRCWSILLLATLLLCGCGSPAPAAVLVQSATGTYTLKTTLAAAAIAPDAAGKTVIVTSPITVSTAIAWPADRTLEARDGGVITFTGAGAITGLGIVPPEMFGAVGNGTTNDSAAFQNAANSAQGWVLKPGKTYLWSNRVYLDGKPGFVINANGATIKESNAFTSVSYGDVNAVFHIINSPGVTVDMLKVDGNKANQSTDISFFRIESSDGVRFTRSKFENCRFHVFYLRTDVTNFDCSFSEFYNNYGSTTGSDAYCSGALNTGSFTNNYFHRQSSAWTDTNGLTQAFYMATGNFTYINNKFKNVGTSYDFRSGTHKVSGGVAESVQLILSMPLTADAVATMSGFSATDVTGIDIGNVRSGIYQQQGWLTLRDVSMTGRADSAFIYGAWVRNSSGGVVRGFNAHNVTIDGATSSGIRFDGTSSENVVDTCVVKNSPSGITTATNTGRTTIRDARFTNISTPYDNSDSTQLILSRVPSSAGQTSGTAVLDGSVATLYTIPHGLGITPANFYVMANSIGARGSFYVTANGTDINIIYAVAPATGTGNLSFRWFATR